MLIVLLVAGVAVARPNWTGEPYLDPGLRFGAVSYSGVTTVQGIGTLEAGYRYAERRRPHWTGRTRALVDGTVGLTSGSYGLGMALGSFIGPDGEAARFQTGPDFWFDYYGTPTSPDYYLAPTAGLSLDNTLEGKTSDLIWIVLGVTPSIVFNQEREAPGLGPIDELSTLLGLEIRVDRVALTIGWRRTWTSAGIGDALVLGGGI